MAGGPSEQGEVQAIFARAHGLLAGGRLDEGIALLRSGLEAAPDDLPALNNLALALLMTRRPAEALEAARRATAAAPESPTAHLNEGNALLDMGYAAAAAEALRRAARLAPEDAGAWYNLGRALLDLNLPAQAEAANRRAIALSPGFAPAHNNLGRALLDMGRIDEAEAAYVQALALKPDFVAADSNRMMRLLYAEGPTPTEILAGHRAWAARQAPDRGPISFTGHDRDPDRRLRLGYISADLRRRPVGYFLDEVLSAHDPAAVEVFAYANHAGEDEMTARLRAEAHHWRSIAGLDDTAAEAMVRADGIDVLIDLSGHTARTRLPLFARRPAPVQASWLGYPGTTGVAAIDYLIMDAATTPPGAEAWCSEAVMRLPVTRFCYSPPAYAPEPGTPPPRPATFGSFNNLSKIGPGVVRLWTAVLRAAPGSRLVLKWSGLADPIVRERFARLFADAGLEGRLELRGPSPHAEMLAEYGDIDVALDPFPFCGGLTSCEALWMGVPVVTLPGIGPPRARPWRSWRRSASPSSPPPPKPTTWRSRRGWPPILADGPNSGAACGREWRHRRCATGRASPAPSRRACARRGGAGAAGCRPRPSM